ncbi:S1 family peptidase [Allosalinactinospora lopnorensis]|uniref:S1 family peptidase n=1 Tax=Allosalinactinospora lopnorensis TaxID=1352348 RepID=UPI000623CAE3|nr:S1 family peptidase [Allosalinactinospora lopnorensis]
MRRKKPALPVALGGGALAVGLVAAGVVLVNSGDRDPAADLSSGQDQAQDLLAAMERDLELTSAEAEERMAEEAEARSIDSRLRSELSDVWGGSYFDGDTGELTVAVTDEAAAADVAAAGATPEVVPLAEEELNAIVDELNAQGSQLDNGITGWFPDISTNTVVVEVLSGSEAAAERLIADAGVDAEMVQITETDEAPQLTDGATADIVGGERYSFNNGASVCSVGFAVEGGFATAGHCGETGVDAASEDGTGTGTVGGSVFPGADMGFVQADDNWIPTAIVSDQQGGTLNVTGGEEAPEGASVCRSGATSGFFCGEVQAKNQTVEYPEGQVQGLTQTDVCIEGGDSGGSYITDDQAQGVASGGSGDCTSGGTSFFQPLNPLLEEFDLTLLTS